MFVGSDKNEQELHPRQEAICPSTEAVPVRVGRRVGYGVARFSPGVRPGVWPGASGTVGFTEGRGEG